MISTKILIHLYTYLVAFTDTALRWQAVLETSIRKVFEEISES